MLRAGDGTAGTMLVPGVTTVYLLDWSLMMRAEPSQEDFEEQVLHRLKFWMASSTMVLPARSPLPPALTMTAGTLSPLMDDSWPILDALSLLEEGKDVQSGVHLQPWNVMHGFADSSSPAQGFR